MSEVSNPYPDVYPPCTQYMGLGRIIHQGRSYEEKCEKCDGRGYVIDPFVRV